MDKTDRLILFPCPFCGGKAYSMVHVKRGTSYDGEKVTHWMPLPEPPGGDVNA
ncbi:MAG: DUF551 domain-containing protein [Oscillospiraceae bacterium]|nr:DUF551 domain-containing protein [Oscillospiraceae bacterium]